MRPHRNPLSPALKPDETLSALATEATGIFKALGFRAGRTNGRHLTVAQWEHLAEQWRAIEIIAGHAREACDRAVREGLAKDAYLPDDLMRLRRIAEDLGLLNVKSYRMAGLRKWITDEIALRVAAGDRESWKEALKR